MELAPSLWTHVAPTVGCNRYLSEIDLLSREHLLPGIFYTPGFGLWTICTHTAALCQRLCSAAVGGNLPSVISTCWPMLTQRIGDNSEAESLELWKSCCLIVTLSLWKQCVMETKAAGLCVCEAE